MHATKPTPICRLEVIDGHLRDLQKFLVQLRQSLHAALEKEVADSASDLRDFELEANLDFILSQNDPQYDVESDNILASRDGFLDTHLHAGTIEAKLAAIDSHNFCDTPNHPMPQQGWLSHDVMEHDMGIDSPAIGPQGLLRVGKVWVDVIIKRQYWLNLHTGQFEK